MSAQETVVPEMPKTYREQLDELDKGHSILITDISKRATWANNISAMHRDTHKQYTIRTQPGTHEVRVWRLK